MIVQLFLLLLLLTLLKKKKKTKAKKKAVKKKKIKIEDKDPKDMSYFEMAYTAIIRLKNRKGSSIQAICKYIIDTMYQGREEAFKRYHLMNALKKNTKAGKFLRNGNTFKIAK